MRGLVGVGFRVKPAVWEGVNRWANEGMRGERKYGAEPPHNRQQSAEIVCANSRPAAVPHPAGAGCRAASVLRQQAGAAGEPGRTKEPHLIQGPTAFSDCFQGLCPLSRNQAGRLRFFMEPTALGIKAHTANTRLFNSGIQLLWICCEI
jgi:hypothetical protein